MNPLKNLAGQTIYYGLSSILGRSINFVLVWLHTLTIPTGEYGVLSDVYAIVAFLNTFFLFGMETTYFRHASLKEEKSVFNNAMSLIITTTTLFSILLFFSSTSIINQLGYPGNEAYIQLLTFIIAIDALMSIPFARLRHQNKAKRFALIRFTNIGITVFLNFLFLYAFDQIFIGEWLNFLQPSIKSIYDPSRKIEYVFWANLLANACFIPLLLPTFKGFRFKLQSEYIKPFLVYTYPLLFAGLSANINEVLDRRLLMTTLQDGFHTDKNGIKYTTEEAVGIYSGCYKLAMFMSLALQAFRYAAEPFFFSKAKDKNAPETYALVMKFFVMTCCIILVAVSVLREPIGAIFLKHESYFDGLIVVPILLLANLFLGIYYNQSVWYKVTDKTYFSTIISGFGAVLTIAFNVLLIPVLGFVGSALATLICYFSMSTMSYFLGQKHFPVPYKISNATLNIGVALLLISITFVINPNGLFLKSLLGIGLTLVYLGFLYLQIGKFLRETLTRK